MPVYKKQSMRLDRKQSVAQKFCSFGRRKHEIPSHVGFVLVDEGGNEHLAGPECARKYSKPEELSHANLVVADIRGDRLGLGIFETETSRFKPLPRCLPTPELERAKAESYAVLYGAELPRLKFALPPRPEIDAAMHGRRHGVAAPEVLRPVWKMMMVNENHGGVAPNSLEVLAACCAAATLIDKCVNRKSSESGQRFFLSMRRSVVEKHWLSEAQVGCLNEELLRIEKRPTLLKPDCFARAHPDYAQREIGF